MPVQLPLTAQAVGDGQGKNHRLPGARGEIPQVDPAAVSQPAVKNGGFSADGQMELRQTGRKLLAFQIQPSSFFQTDQGGFPQRFSGADGQSAAEEGLQLCHSVSRVENALCPRPKGDFRRDWGDQEQNKNQKQNPFAHKNTSCGLILAQGSPPILPFPAGFFTKNLQTKEEFFRFLSAKLPRIVVTMYEGGIALIEVSHLTKRYGSHLALDDLSFTIPEGQIYGLLGPNGAGKSTTMNILTGCLAATSGRVRIDGVDIFEDPMAAKKHLGYLPELPPLYMDRTPEEYLRFVARAKGIGEVRGELERVMALTQITDVKDRLIRNLSKGYRQRVGIAQAILGDPDIIILDEPTVGLDPRQITEIRELIQKLGENKTVILSSHILSEVQAVCDSILILSRGKLVACDTPDNLERLLTGGTALELEADTQPERLEKLLGNLPGVTGLTVGETAGKHAWARLETGKENLETLSKAVFFRLCEEKLPLLRLTPAKASLEDIFLELTGGKEA